MNTCGSGSVFPVNAEVDSMGGVVECGVGVCSKTSPRRAAIEKAQAQLRQEYNVREERRRELEFLEKGGNPLDFKLGNAASVSGQSTSLNNYRTGLLMESEAKGSFAQTASPKGDSVESSGRPGGSAACEFNSTGDFAGDNELINGKKRINCPGKRSYVVPSEKFSKFDEMPNLKGSEDSAIFRPYARRNRSRPNRDGARSNSTDLVLSFGARGSSFVLGMRNAKGSVRGTSNRKGQPFSFASFSKSKTSGGVMISQTETSNILLSDMELDGTQPIEGTSDCPRGRVLDVMNGIEANISRDNQPHHLSEANIQTFHIEQNNNVILSDDECQQFQSSKLTDKGLIYSQPTIFSDLKRHNEDADGNMDVGTKRLISESSCMQNYPSTDINNSSNLCIFNGNEVTTEVCRKTVPESEGKQNSGANEAYDEHNKSKVIVGCAATNICHLPVCESCRSGSSLVKINEKILNPEIQNEMIALLGVKGIEPKKEKDSVLSDVSSFKKGNISSAATKGSISSIQEISMSSVKRPASSSDHKACSDDCLNMADKNHEDSILEHAKNIEAKRKSIAELSSEISCSVNQQKSHWDFVLEEIVWLANDFVQERLWKMTAAAQICHQVAFISQMRIRERKKLWKLKKISHTLVKAVMQFWHMAELHMSGDDQGNDLKNCKDSSGGYNENEFWEQHYGKILKQTHKEQTPRKNCTQLILDYAARFLKCNSLVPQACQEEAPGSPDGSGNLDIMDISCRDQLKEESLFYVVPSGAMETYRMSIESLLTHREKTGSSLNDDVSAYDIATEFGYNGNEYNDGETNTYYSRGIFDCHKTMKHAQKKRKNIFRSYGAPAGQDIVEPQQNFLIGKRLVGSLNLDSVPTKSIITASRQRVTSPFSAGAASSLQVPSRTDPSSGDTSSIQDDRSTLFCGSQNPKGLEVECFGNAEKQFQYEYSEISTKPKRRKKAKHLNDTFKRKGESHLFDCIGTGGLHGPLNEKRMKMMNKPMDNMVDNLAMLPGSTLPVASHISNMSNPWRLMKLIGGRDRSRKSKWPKVHPGHVGPGSCWSHFEDQALIVFVHDMGPNWELVSDVINHTLQFKCVFRKPNECKERHNILMDKVPDDGADSAEDSGTSQPYPSTLPGIPKGSARQLFQQLLGPMEESVLKSHFEKIILIGKSQPLVSQDPKQVVPVHNSQIIALSHVFPNNLNGNILLPNDLSDAPISSTDAISLGYQGSHANNLAMRNQSAAGSPRPTCSANSALQESSAVHGDNSHLSPAPHNAPVSVPRTPLPADEQQRLHHVNQMLSGRNLMQSSLPISGAAGGVDHGSQVLTGGTGVEMMLGMHRSMPILRPGLPGFTSSSLPNSASVISPSMVRLAGSVSGQCVTFSGQGNPVLRPQESSHMMQPVQNLEQQHKMSLAEIQQGSGQGIPATNGFSSAFANKNTLSPTQAYRSHTQHPHQASSQQPHLSNSHHFQGASHVVRSQQQQAYALRLVKERHMQQQLLQQQQQQQQQFAMIPPGQQVQPRLQAPKSASSSSSSLNSSEIHCQMQLQHVSVPPLVSSTAMTAFPSRNQQQQTHKVLHHGFSANPLTGVSGSSNQMGRQRQLQLQKHFQGQHHPHQLQSQFQQQIKLLRGNGRGNVAVHQNYAIDHSHSNGFSTSPGIQGGEKGEQFVHLIQGAAGLYPGNGLNAVQPSKTVVHQQASSRSPPKQKLLSSSMPSLPMQLPYHMTPRHLDNSSAQGPQVLPRLVVPEAVTMSNHHAHHPQAQAHHNHHHCHKHFSHVQPPIERMPSQNHQDNYATATIPQANFGRTEQQQPLKNNSPVESAVSAIPGTINDDLSGMSLISPVMVQRNSSENDSGIQSMHSQIGCSTSSPCFANSDLSPVPSVSQSLLVQQHGHGVGAGATLWKQPEQHCSTLSPVSSEQLQLTQDQQQCPEETPRLQVPHQQRSELE